MQPDKFLDQRKPDAGAFETSSLCPLDPVEAFKQARKLIAGNADAGVAYLENSMTPVRRGLDRYGDRSPVGELERVRKKIEDDLFP